MSCGAPQAIAPELVGWRDEEATSCYWIRQRETADEPDRAVKISHTQELGCHRYLGREPAILERLPREACDFFCPEMALRYRAGFGPSGVQLKLSLFASQDADGVPKRLWRRVVREKRKDRGAQPSLRD
jgi:hypothetical protein